MKLETIKNHLRLAFSVREANPNSDTQLVYGYLGEPGVGKTAKIRAAAEELGATVKQMLGSSLSPTDIVAMMPDVNEGLLAPMFNSEVPWESLVGDARVVWFLDECTNTHPEVWKSFQKLIHERELYGKKLGPNVVIVLAGNRVTDKAGSANVSTAVANRITWYTWNYDNEEYIQHLGRAVPGAHTVTAAAYLMLNELGGNDFADALKTIGKGEYTAWASPRSFERLLVRMNASATPLGIVDMAGDIGQGRAVALHAFMSMADELPRPGQIFSDPQGTPIPDKPDRRYALTSMLLQKADRDNFASVATYMRRMETTLQVFFLRMLTQMPNANACQNTTAYTNWLVQPEMSIALQTV